MQQASEIQRAMGGAQLTQGDGESDLDFSIRQVRAQRDAVARISPEAAYSLNTKLLKLGEMKFQQTRLTARDQPDSDERTRQAFRRHRAAV